MGEAARRRSCGDVLSVKLGVYIPRTEEPALERKVAEWSQGRAVIWNAGIGSAASFVPTLSRLLYERTNDLHGPYDLITRVSLTPAQVAGGGSSRAPHRLAFEVLMEMARSQNISLPDDILQLNEDERYFGYDAISDDLLLKAFGPYYAQTLDLPLWHEANFDSVLYDMFSPVQDRITRALQRMDMFSPVLERIIRALQGKKHLLVIENLDAPMSLDALVLLGGRLPSQFNNRWIISTTSKYVFDKSRLLDAHGFQHFEEHRALPFDDAREEDWAALIKEALHDAAVSIHDKLQHQQGERDQEFWLHVAHHCLCYGILYHPLQGRQATSNACSVTSDELVRCWVAEDLLSSSTLPTCLYYATGRKQSNDYRSAYEAGKVVIEALQKYSLLPAYSVFVPTPTSSTGSLTATPSASNSQDEVTGVSKLAEGVPQLEQDELVDRHESGQLKWVSFMNDDGRHVSWNWRPPSVPYYYAPRTTIWNMSTLILRGRSNISDFPFDEVLDSQLIVLDLSYTTINFLPRGISQLLYLHLLSLRGCSQLETLSPPPSTSEQQTPPPLAILENLEVLDMNGVPLLEITQQDSKNKRNLHYLDLSEDMFNAMQSLHTLRLINNKLLMSLPMSISEAKGLKELHISNCVSLKLDQSLWQLLPFVDDLYIQTWEPLEDIKIHGHPNLKTFTLSGPLVKCLSLRECSRLESVNFSDDLTALEQVDLSGTAIEEIPHNLPNARKLKMLLLLNVPSFKRFPWHQLERFPKVFFLDQCAGDDNQFSKMFAQKKTCADDSQHNEGTTNIAQMNLIDNMMFHSFNADAVNNLVKNGQFLLSFNIRINPRSVTGKEPRNNYVELCTRAHMHSTYSDVQYSETDSIMPMMKLQPRQRHVELSAKNQYPHGLKHLLSVTNSMLVTDDAFVRCLTELNYGLMSLEECQLQRCHQMTVVFIMRSVPSDDSEDSEALPYLQILQASCLKNLLTFIKPSRTYSRLITLKVLKHIHIEHCPRMKKMFPCSLSLPALETLVILFCSNLKQIFYRDGKYDVAPSPLPGIVKIYLQELPQLQRIHDDVMFQFEAPKWEKLFVRGCPSFHHLPLLKKEYRKSKVQVSGERDWWGKLKWSLPEQSDCYLHVPPPEFAWRKKYIIRSYLR
ncbi:hypothetical protein HU200_029103 [Digitaria exilis]|uniref:Disease resistance protein At4g27190-like leucine-rich repeats domain-containing protein n=1 Tax=Digitaria exilis TaxID=1010633 RepID=A0A835BT33_9POAL|nr:hypothetical protein HU200_029103 [Digitaria exilis]